MLKIDSNFVDKVILKKKNILIGILSFGFLVRLVYALFAHSNNIMTTFSDDWGYWDFAKNSSLIVYMYNGL